MVISHDSSQSNEIAAEEAQRTKTSRSPFKSYLREFGKNQLCIWREK